MPSGMTDTYNLTTGIMLDMEPMIQLLSPYDIPLTGGYGADGRTALSTGTCFEKKVEWLDETLLTPRSTAAAVATTSEGVVTVASGDQLKFSTGDVILAGSEYMQVTNYGNTADTLLVTRAFNGSSGATLATNTPLVGIGLALPEGSDPKAARYIDRSARFNYTQIFGPHKISVSGTDNVVRKYGIQTAGTTEFEHQQANRLKEIAVSLEQAVIYGKRLDTTTGGLSSGNARMMGGLTYYITTNVDTTTTIISETALLTNLQTVYEAGGLPDRAVVGSTQKRKISAFNQGLATGSVTVNVDRGDRGRGQVVDYFDSDFGRITVVLDRWVRASDLFLFNRDQAEVCTLRPIQFEPLAKTGDSIHGQIVGEKTFKFQRERHAVKLTALQ